MPVQNESVAVFESLLAGWPTESARLFVHGTSKAKHVDGLGRPHPGTHCIRLNIELTMPMAATRPFDSARDAA